MSDERRIKARLVKAFKATLSHYPLTDGDIILVKDQVTWNMMPALADSLNQVTDKKVAFLFAPQGLGKVSAEDLRAALTIVDGPQLIIP